MLPNMIGVVNRTIVIFGKIHFLLISENEFTNEIQRDGISSYMEFHDELIDIDYIIVFNLAEIFIAKLTVLYCDT